MASRHIKKGDQVLVISGSHSGKQGKVLQVLPRKDRAIVEGVAMIKKHQRKDRDNPEGSIVEREASIHLSNLKKVAAAEKTESGRED
jgi:large subunit ribosomal protein L24